MNFETVYIEEDTKEDKNTLDILRRIKFKNLIYCKNYTEIFNPRSQNFRIQKKKPNIILAKKRKNLIVSTPDDFSIGFTENYYFSHMLNCIYDCKYCFLQGMFNSANFVIFTNFNDFINEIKNKTLNKNHKPCFFSGYDCDSLALEKITNFLKVFLNCFKEINNGYLEVRTKSTNIDVFKNIEPIENVIIAYSLNPDIIIKEFEQKTPSLKKRINSIKFLQERGWKVGLRFDPLINYEENKYIYKNFFSHIFNHVQVDKIHSVTTGYFRMPNSFFNKLISIRPEDSLILNHLKNERVYKNQFLRRECEEELAKFIDQKKIFAN